MFETMEFEWRPKGGRPVGRPRARPLRKPRRAPGYGVWPYRLPVFEPLPLLEPPAGDAPDPDEGADGDELPPTIAHAVGQMPHALQPAYAPIAALDRAPGDVRTHGPGLYYLEFTVNGRRRGYSGQAGHMGQRLAQHRVCAAMMGIRPADVSVYIAPNLADGVDRRNRERTLHDTMFRRFPGVLTNQRRELEFEVLGEEHEAPCGCKRCRQAPFSDEQETALAMELLAVQSEAELEQFLGKVFKGVWNGIKKVAKPLGGILKGIAKKALPFVGGALGSFIPIPGVGTALGRALGGALGNALELEMQEMPEVDRELEAARRFVRIAGSAAQAAGDSDGSPPAVRRAVLQALLAHAPRFGQS
ncbi:hypothetical protein [Pseudoduganella violaceinigra]|uniref:hypothetical protein n=1 Tax=Pseudoduganella violaceinigra TaxID=246602 RepID=UPI00040FF653|nr:hypothetical protein [Pseudoduganella violaceinigra]